MAVLTLYRHGASVHTHTIHYHNIAGGLGSSLTLHLGFDLGLNRGLDRSLDFQSGSGISLLLSLVSSSTLSFFILVSILPETKSWSWFYCELPVLISYLVLGCGLDLRVHPAFQRSRS